MNSPASNDGASRRVFLSYAYDDGLLVHDLARKLSERNVNVWFGNWHLKPGEDIQRAIEREIERTDTVLVILTSATLRDSRFRTEVDFALERRGIEVTRTPLSDPRVVRVSTGQKAQGDFTWQDADTHRIRSSASSAKATSC